MTSSISLPHSQLTNKPKIQILCIDITSFHQNTQFIFCTLAVFVFFLLYGYMQELLFTLEGFQPFGWYLTLVQFAYYTLFGTIETYAKHVSNRRYTFDPRLL